MQNNYPFRLNNLIIYYMSSKIKASTPQCVLDCITAYKKRNPDKVSEWNKTYYEKNKKKYHELYLKRKESNRQPKENKLDSDVQK